MDEKDPRYEKLVKEVAKLIGVSEGFIRGFSENAIREICSDEGIDLDKLKSQIEKEMAE